jgi:hypothetical protein
LGSFVSAQLFQRVDATMHHNTAHLTAAHARHRNYALVQERGLQSVQLIDDVASAEAFFISQYRGPYNPQATDGNANCGPASLAMVLKRFLSDTAAVVDGDPERLVQLARLAMTGGTNPNTNTDNDDVVRGASRLGMPTLRAWSVAGIDSALDAGAVVVVSGSPSAPGSFADRLDYPHCRHGHFVVLVGRKGDHYIMNDPESPDGAHEITRSELSGFISYWPPKFHSLHGGIAIYAPARPVLPRIAELEKRLQYE